MGSDRIMTPEHPLWLDFLSNLSRIPICTGTTRQARIALTAMSGIDVQESLDALAHVIRGLEPRALTARRPGDVVAPLAAMA